MGAERMQYVHTRFYITRPDDEGVYEADTVDYLVRDDGEWYVRYEGGSDRRPPTAETDE